MAAIDAGKFLTQLVDWKDFELFVAELYKDDGDLIIQHDVTEIGKSQAKRQIDVLVIQKTKLHTIKTIIECKRWKNRVDRQVIDVLAASVEDLNANKGVIFTTKAYEEGAIQYAKNKNIDIFIVRDLTDDEWGKPGRNLTLYLQMFSGSIKNIQFNNLRFHAVNGQPPKNGTIRLGMKFSKEEYADEKFNLISLNDSIKVNIVKLLTEVFQAIQRQLFDGYNGVIQPEYQANEIAYNVPVMIDFSTQQHKFIKHEHGFISFDSLTFDLLQTVTQNKIKSDRAKTVDFVVMVENYITNQKNYVSKEKDNDRIILSDPVLPKPQIDESEIVKNGSIIKIMTEITVEATVKSETEIIQLPQRKVNLNIEHP